MQFYKSQTGELIQFNPETGVYKLRSAPKNLVLSSEEFLSRNCKKIKKDEFSRLMNIFFKDLKHEWVYDHSHFKKLPNFEDSGSSLCSNYVLGKDIPFHETPYKQNTVLVYHWGKVYYHTISYNGYKSGQLLDPKTFAPVRWAQLKHCAPIQNTTSKRIC